MYTMKNKYNCISVVSITKVLFVALLFILPNLLSAQQSPSIQTGVTFQWLDEQTNGNLNLPATIQSLTIDGVVYNTFVVPTSYEMTRLGPDGNGPNRIRENGAFVGGNSGQANWNTNAINAFQDKNLNHYFTANPNGQNICSNFDAALITDAQKQTIFYSPAIPSNEGGVIAVTERGGNNCFYIEAWGIPVGGGTEEKLGETFIRNVGDYTGCDFGVPKAGSDYWKSGRCNENGQTIGIGLFFLDDIAPTGSKITKIEFIGASRDHGDGKFFILQKYAVDQENTNCIDSTYSGNLNVNNNVPDGSTFSVLSGPTPAGQSFTISADGMFSYVPIDGYTGNVEFEYEVCLPFPNNTVCDTATISINFEPLPTTPEIEISCTSTNNFVITVTSPIGDEFEYSLNNGPFQSDTDFINLTEGNYVLTVRNSFTECESISPTTPIVLDNLELTGTVTDILCGLEATGAIDITASGGAPPYTYSWSNSATTEDLSGISGGTYTITVTDANACNIISEDFTVNQPNEALSASIIAITNEECNGNLTGSFTVEGSGGTPPYSYSLDAGVTSQTSGLFDNLAAGDYTVLISDTNDCTFNIDPTIGTGATESPEITVPATLTIEGCTAAGITNASALFPYSTSQSGDVQSTFASNANYNASDDFNIQSITYLDIVTSSNNCPITVLRTFTVTDNCDNTATAMQTITVQDTIAPAVTRPASDQTVQCDGTGNTSELQSWLNSKAGAEATDSCGTVSWSNNYTNLLDECGETGTTLVTFTATDSCGNATNTSALFTISDLLGPSIDDEATDLIVECDGSGNITDLNNWLSANGGAFANDLCGNISWSHNFTVLIDDCGNTGSALVTFTATDDCGNTTDTSARFSISDTTPPSLVFPAEITVECTEETSSTSTGMATGNDSCGSVVITESDLETATCGNTKTIIRTWTATDACGNSVSADQTILVLDTTPPTIDNSGIQNIDIQCGVSPDGTLDAWILNNAGAIASDSCGSVTWSNNYGQDTNVNCANGAITIIFTATDACGNAETTTATYSIIDTVAPVLTAPADVTIECNEDSSPTNTGTATASDDCATADVSFSDSEISTCGLTTIITRTWTATDACGNADSSDQTITIIDTTAPTVLVPADLTIECNEDSSSTNTGIATGTDTCGSVTITQSDLETVTCGDSKTITRTWTATDACGNAVSANQTIIIQDKTPPSITAPANITIECNEDETSANTGIAVATDTCGTVTITQSDLETSACGNTKTILRTWTATDACGNSVSAEQSIIVEDTTPPTINNSSLQDIDIECGVTPSGTLDTWLLNNAGATATDSCGSVSWSNNFGQNTNVSCANGAITIIFTATDTCGNTASTSASYSIVDTVAPVISVPNTVTIECNEDTSPLNTGNATATDDCATTDISYSDSEVNACGNTKTIVRTWTATDACGNTDTANQTIIIEDNTPPTLTVPAAITIECNEDTSSANTGIAIGVDTCGTVTLSQSDIETMACGSSKTILRTWTATDACGNSVSANQTITVEDTTPPSLSVPADVTIECNEDTSSTSTGIATAIDTCGSVTITESDTEIADCGITKTITRTWTATDICGNSISETQIINVVDTIAPIILRTASDQTVECDGAGNSSELQVWLDTFAGAAATDSCSAVTWTNNYASLTDTCGETGQSLITFTASDACGNTIETMALFTITDFLPPSIDLNAEDLTVECDGLGNTTQLNDWLNTNGGATATDICSTITWTNNFIFLNDNCGNTGTALVTFIASDDCGFSSTTSATFTIIDSIAPSLSLPADITIECDEDTSSANTGVAIGTDSCSSVSISESDVETLTCGNTKTIIRTWAATDACGNTTSAEQTITVQDTTPPVIDNSGIENIDIQCGITPDGTLETWLSNNAGATATDNCGNVTWSNDYSANTDVDCANGAITVIFTATDDCGNTSPITATYSIIDKLKPVLTIPADVSIECTEDTTPSNTGTATATDDCAAPNVSFSDSEIEACGNTKTITRTWTATDACGNTTSANQTITVEDTTPPTFSVPIDIEIECDADATDLSLTGDVTDEADNCTTSLEEATYSDSIADGNCPRESVITRTWSLTDACNNTTTFIQTIIIKDTTAPTFTVPVDILVECDVDTTDLTLTGDVTNEADNCSSDLEATYSDSIATGDCANESIITRTWTLEDDCDNTTTLIQTITIQDTTAPTFTVPAAILVECDIDVADLSLTGDVTDEADNCDTGIEATFTDTIETGDCPNTSVITRTWSLADSCDNTTVLIQIITLEDTTPPTFSVPANITIECDENAEDLALTGDVTDEADNCESGLEATFTDTSEVGDCPNTSVISRTWSLTDACDNTTSFLQTITVQDLTAPSFNEILPLDLNAECDTVPTAQILTATDNCGTAQVTFEENIENGTCTGDFIIKRIWTATDSCGNDFEHVQIITVQDNTAPTLLTPFDENITVECDGIPATPDLVFEDSCSIDIEVVMGETSNQINDFEDYQVIRTWEVTDECGNLAVFTQTISVEIGNVIDASDANRCILDSEFDLFDLLSGDFDIDGTWSLVSGNASLDGSFFDPASVEEIGIYKFKYAITEGTCTTDVEVSVTINDDCVVLPCGAEDVVVSKTVTANGDNFNEFFAITGVEDCGFIIELQIFNRWGAEIYKSNNYQNNWNGDARGSSAGSSGKVPTGTYYYIINLRNSGLKPFAGPIYVATNK